MKMKSLKIINGINQSKEGYNVVQCGSQDNSEKNKKKLFKNDENLPIYRDVTTKKKVVLCSKEMCHGSCYMRMPMF